jgi:tetratricopeptide (TPR) repeat protein
MLYEKVVAIAPDFAVGYFNLGAALKAMGLLPESIVQYRKAIALQPEYAEAYQNLGVVLLNKVRLEIVFWLSSRPLVYMKLSGHRKDSYYERS